MKYKTLREDRTAAGRILYEILMKIGGKYFIIEEKQRRRSYAEGSSGSGGAFEKSH